MSIARNIKIELEIHAITCPGVWLCQNNGDIELSITALGYSFSLKPLKPRFPLCYHEKVMMDGYFSDVNNVADLEKALDEEQINFTLWQKGRRLAYYLNKIGVILNYTGCMNKNFAITDNAIIMTRGSCFPGTISPKIEYTASIQYTTKCMKCGQTVLSQSHGEKRIIKNLEENGANKSKILHQKPVCHAHTKQRHRWRCIGGNEKNDLMVNDLCNYCLDAKDVSTAISTSGQSHAPFAAINGSSANNNNKEMHETPQLAKCGHLKSDQFGESFHSENSCRICVKYALLFDRSKEINETISF